MRGLQADNASALEQCMECEHQKEQQKELEQQVRAWTCMAMHVIP